MVGWDILHCFLDLYSNFLKTHSNIDFFFSSATSLWWHSFSLLKGKKENQQQIHTKKNAINFLEGNKIEAVLTSWRNGSGYFLFFMSSSIFIWRISMTNLFCWRLSASISHCPGVYTHRYGAHTQSWDSASSWGNQRKHSVMKLTFSHLQYPSWKKVMSYHILTLQALEVMKDVRVTSVSAVKGAMHRMLACKWC